MRGPTKSASYSTSAPSSTSKPSGRVLLRCSRYGPGPQGSSCRRARSMMTWLHRSGSHLQQVQDRMHCLQQLHKNQLCTAAAWRRSARCQHLRSAGSHQCRTHQQQTVLAAVAGAAVCQHAARMSAPAVGCQILSHEGQCSWAAVCGKQAATASQAGQGHQRVAPTAKLQHMAPCTSACQGQAWQTALVSCCSTKLSCTAYLTAACTQSAECGNTKAGQ